MQEPLLLNLRPSTYARVIESVQIQEGGRRAITSTIVLHTFFLRCTPSDFATILLAFESGDITNNITAALQTMGYPQPTVNPPKTF